MAWSGGHSFSWVRRPAPVRPWTAAVYRALALMPGITQLGELDHHAGTTGLGFASTSPYFGKREIIVDPSTGRLLELRNISGTIPYMAMGTGISHSYPEPDRTPGSTVGGSGNVEWIDPVGDPTVAPSLPSHLAAQLPLLTAQVTATETPGTYRSTNDLQSQLDNEFGHQLDGGPKLPMVPWSCTSTSAVRHPRFRTSSLPSETPACSSRWSRRLGRTSSGIRSPSSGWS